MKKNFTIVIILLIELCASYGYSQTSSVYNTIVTKDVLYYSVEEIVNLKFGGTKTRYTVSDLSLISKADLGPNNIRIITPIYKNENFNQKSYYIETKNLNPEPGINDRPTNLTEIKIDSKKIEIPDNPKIEKEALALVIKNIFKPELIETPKPVEPTKPIEVVKNSPTREKVDHININVMDIYERVAEKGYKSAYLYRELANYFFFKKEMAKAAKWYEELFLMTPDLEPVYYFRFGDALRKTGKTQRGEELVEKFNKLTE
ncbi:hypothetical protein SLW70_09365 [Flavobacterium sp. NG2]|uniref:tetratricopeptide repeat protein n=1 Tax=Flavobacterium sp. NG2 TaxID=3097547 RepID=UPI002A810645|nr:hypothetical protein [Flavobacterium sp. NG2]WPR70158.1 hypothetical protein SLW70_09365 [Flavobacterium sp. NG2]